MKGKYYFLMVAMALCFASCGKNESGENKEPEPPAKVTADITYHLGGGKDLQNLFDISVRYTDKDNKTVTEQIVSLSWFKEIDNAEVPFTASMELLLTPKNDYPDKATYEVGVGLGISYVTSTGSSKFWSNNSTLNINKSQVKTYQESVSAREFKATESIK